MPNPGAPKTEWRVIEGDARRVLTAVQDILESTGDDAFEVEFRIYRSTCTKRAGAKSRPGAKKKSTSRRSGRRKSCTPARPGGLLSKVFRKGSKPKKR